MYRNNTYITPDKPGLYTPINPGFHPQESDKVERFEATLSDEYWEYRRKWEENPKNHIVGDFPINIDFEVTNACNLKCKMCPRTENIENGTFWDIGYIDIDDYKNVIDEGMRWGLCAVKYNFMGEPLLHPDLVEMIKYAKQAGVLDVMFNTNAVLLTEEMSEALIDSGLDKIFFSFDSPYKKTYESIRVGAKFKEVLNNIVRFNWIRGDKVKPLTRVSMVMLPENEDERNDFKALFSSIVDVIAFIEYIPIKKDRKPQEPKGKYCCPQLWQRMVIHPDGGVSPCCGNFDRGLTMGNIFEQSVHDIWTGERYKTIRDLHTSGNYDKIPTCAECPMANNYA